MSHYFIEDPRVSSDPRVFKYTFNDRSYTFTTDAGVFSHGRMDYATDLLLRHLPPLTGSLLDMGCGYGCMGIVLASAYGLRLTMADVNPAALRLAAKNCADNRVEAQIIQSNCFAQIEGDFDTIVINPPIHAGKSVVYAMYRDAQAHLKENGCLYIVIQKKHGAESTMTQLRALYDRCEILHKKKGYYIVGVTVRIPLNNDRNDKH